MSDQLPTCPMPGCGGELQKFHPFVYEDYVKCPECGAITRAGLVRTFSTELTALRKEAEELKRLKADLRNLPECELLRWVNNCITNAEKEAETDAAQT